MRERLRSEDGFSLTELLMAMSIGSIVLWALMTIFVQGIKASVAVEDRADTAQRARIAVDRLETVLNSQVCLDSVRTPIQGSVSGPQRVQLYADLGDSSFTPRQYLFAYDPTTKVLTESMWVGTGTPPNVTFASGPSSTRVLASNVLPVGGAAQPIFTYHRYNADGSMSGPLNPGSALADSNARSVVRVGFTVQVLSDRSNIADRLSSVIEGQAIAGSADPLDPASGPRCS